MFKKVNIVFLPLFLIVLMTIFEPFANAGMNEKIDDVGNGIESDNFATVHVAENTDFSDSQMTLEPPQTGTSTTPLNGLYGYISNSLTGLPIKGARVSVAGSSGYKSTDSTGRYDLNLVQGNYSIWARKSGYYDKTIFVSVSSSGTQKNIKLKPRPSTVQNRE